MLNRVAPTAGSNDIDLSAFWMPFTPNQRFKSAPLMIASAELNHYVLQDGRKVLDGSAALWCVNAGHQRPRIVEAIRQQSEQLDFVSCYSNGHEPAFRLASRLAALAPGNLNHVFFANSGSEAVDTALKIALAYHHARGEAGRFRFVGRDRAYHGVGFGGLSVGGLGGNKKQFGPLLPGVVHMPHTHDPDRNGFSKGLPLADRLEAIIATCDASTIAAVIVEPVAGAGGLLPPPVGYLQRLRDICDKHGLLLIFDEVITAFGRLGRTFASEALGVVPDMITCAKGLTNAAVPMGAVIVSDQIHDAIMAATAAGPELSHGYTYSGHPLACAAALATLDVHDEDGLNDHALKIAKTLEDDIHALRSRRHVRDIRNIGVLAAVEIESRPGAPGARGVEIRGRALELGALVRAAGDLLLLSPPLTFTPGDMSELVSIVGRALDQVE